MERHIISKKLFVTVAKDMTPSSLAARLLEMESELKALGMIDIKMAFADDHYGLGEDNGEEASRVSIFVSGERPATDAEQTAYEAERQEDSYVRCKGWVENFERMLRCEKEHIERLKRNFEKAKAESEETGRSLGSSIKTLSIAKAYYDREKWARELERQIALYNPLLSLPKEEFLRELARISEEDSEFHKKWMDR